MPEELELKKLDPKPKSKKTERRESLLFIN